MLWEDINCCSFLFRYYQRYCWGFWGTWIELFRWGTESQIL